MPEEAFVLRIRGWREISTKVRSDAGSSLRALWCGPDFTAEAAQVSRGHGWSPRSCSWLATGGED